MLVEELAGLTVGACEAEGADYMLTGAFAYGVYAIPRSTKDVDVVLSIADPGIVQRIIERLDSEVEFGAQVQFDTLTWGRRHVGRVRSHPQLQLELFELFDDPFVVAQFEGRVKLKSRQIGRGVWIPRVEDVVVQKLRWARAKDLDDALDVLAVQGVENLDMAYVRRWCREHGSEGRLEEILGKVEGI